MKCKRAPDRVHPSSSSNVSNASFSSTTSTASTATIRPGSRNRSDSGDEDGDEDMDADHGEDEDEEETQTPHNQQISPQATLRLRIGGFDKRKEKFKGWVEFEAFAKSHLGIEEGSFVVMKRDEGSPISWRQLWKGLILSETVKPWVLMKPNSRYR